MSTLKMEAEEISEMLLLNSTLTQKSIENILVQLLVVRLKSYSNQIHQAADIACCIKYQSRSLCKNYKYTIQLARLTFLQIFNFT